MRAEWMLRACSHTERKRERKRVRGRRVRWGRLDAEGLSGCTCPFPGPLSFEAPRPCKSRMQQSTKCERSIQKPLFSPHSQTLDLQHPVLPVLPVPTSKVPSERRGENYVKGIDVMQLFPCSPSCLSHYPAERSKQNNHKNSLTWTWEAWWADLHSSVLHNISLSPPSLCIALFLSWTWSVVLYKWLAHKRESEQSLFHVLNAQSNLWFVSPVRPAPCGEPELSLERQEFCQPTG